MLGGCGGGPGGNGGNGGDDVFSLAGTVLDGAAQALAGVTLTVSGASGVAGAAVTDAQGAFAVAGLPAGTYTVTPTRAATSFEPDARRVTVGPSQTGLDFTGSAAVEGTFSISGTIVGRTGAPLSGVMIDVAGALESGHALTGADGTYQVINLPAGTYTVTLSLAEHVFEPPSRSIDVSASTTEIDFTGVPGTSGTFSISGTIADGADAPIVGVTVTVDDGAGHVATATTDAQGFFVAGDLAAGTYAVRPGRLTSAQSTTFVPVSRSATVGPSQVEQDFVGTHHSEDGSGLAASAWPMFMRDPQHTGRSPHVGPQTANVDWTSELRPTPASTEKNTYAYRMALAADGDVYVGGNEYAHAIEGGTGAFVGQFPATAPTVDRIFEGCPAVAQDGTVYVPSWDRHLYALDSSGAAKWGVELGGAVRSSPVVAQDGTVYVAADGQLYAISPAGAVLWSYNAGTEIRSDPAIGHNGVIHVGCEDGHLYAILPDGSLAWSFEAQARVRGGPSVADDGAVHFGSDDRCVYALEPDGEFRWSYETDGVVEACPAVGADGAVYVGSSDSTFYVLEANGTPRWTYVLPSPIYSSAALGSDGKVYVGCNNDRLYCLTATGTLQWNSDDLWDDSHLDRSSPALSSDGAAFMVGRDSDEFIATLTCFRQ